MKTASQNFEVIRRKEDKRNAENYLRYLAQRASTKALIEAIEVLKKDVPEAMQ